MASTLEKPAELTFQTAKVTQTSKPPAGAFDSVTRLFISPTNTTDQTGNNQAPLKQKKVPSTSAVDSPHRPDSDMDLGTNMDTDQ